jgi:predicted nucleic acid-binding protein
LAEQALPAGPYDALVAATSDAAKIELVTCDRRAAVVYDKYGVRFRLLM